VCLLRVVSGVSHRSFGHHPYILTTIDQTHKLKGNSTNCREGLLDNDGQRFFPSVLGVKFLAFQTQTSESVLTDTYCMITLIFLYNWEWQPLSCWLPSVHWSFLWCKAKAWVLSLLFSLWLVWQNKLQSINYIGTSRIWKHWKIYLHKPLFIQWAGVEIASIRSRSWQWVTICDSSLHIFTRANCTDSSFVPIN